jgi:hypothetical protein
MTVAAARAERPEIQVLVGCVRPRLAEEEQAALRGSLRQPLDWEFLLTEARRHAVLPLLHRTLHGRFGAETPSPVLDSLRQACQRSQQRNLALTAELLRVLDLFEKAGIPAVPFKGPVLAAVAYGDLSLRIFGDLDILLREEDLGRARDVLVAQGYIPEFTFTPVQEKAYRKAECALQLRHPGRNVVLELHWLLTERYLSIDLAGRGFWDRLHPVALAGRTVPAFAMEDLLLYLSVHGSKHRWERLEWLCSFVAVASQPGLDWEAVRRRARESGAERLLHMALLLSRDLLGLELPEEVRAAAERDRAAQDLAGEIAATLFEPVGEEPGNRGSWYVYLLRSRERWRDRFRIVIFSWVRLPHPSSAELVALPARLSFLYYLFRPARLLRASFGLLTRRAQPGRAKESEPICTR